MIEITGYENIGKGKYRTTFDNGTTCVLYRTEAVRYSIMEGAFISEADYEKLITEVVGKRAKKRALHLLEQMDRRAFIILMITDLLPHMSGIIRTA